MKNIIINLIIVFGFILVSCSNDDATQTPLNAKVLRQGDKCELVDDGLSGLDYLIEFEDSSNLPIENQSIYYAANLPENFKVDGLEIRINYRNLNENEFVKVFCNLAEGGDEFPFIYILDVNSVN